MDGRISLNNTGSYYYAFGSVMSELSFASVNVGDTSKYRYGNASVPHMDFAFGTNWRMGEWGTTSNRRGSHTIQVFSSDGCYNNGAKEANGRCSTTKVDNIQLKI